MDFSKSEIVKKIAAQAKDDIEVLVQANSFAHKKEFSAIKNFSASQVVMTGSVEYLVWCYLAFNEEEYIDFLKKLDGKTNGWVSWKKFRNLGNDTKLRDIEIIDRIDYSVKFLSKQFDLPIPSLMKERIEGMPISIKNTPYYAKRLIEELVFFINRVLMLISNIERFHTDKYNNISQFKNEWIQKLTKNKHAELLNEMLQFYQINKVDEKLLKTISLLQRLNKLKDEKHSFTRDNDKLDIELNKITAAILEIIK